MNNNQKQQIKVLIRQNDYASRFGQYKTIARPHGERNSYCERVYTGPINNICTVDVINANHYELLENLVEEKGLLCRNKILLIQTIGDKFMNNPSDSLEGLRDMQFMTRTNFAGIHSESQRKEIAELECVYYPTITGIRNADMVPCDQTQIFQFSMILTIPLSDCTLIKDGKMLCKKDFISALQKIETVFQTAIVKQHKKLIFCPYGIDEIDGLPDDDVIKMFNSCILKYGHKFTHIIFSMPEMQYGKKTFEKFYKKIVKPQELTSDIDAKYESMKSHFKLKNLQELEELE